MSDFKLKLKQQQILIYILILMINWLHMSIIGSQEI
jgi:hypothetical protein